MALWSVGTVHRLGPDPLGCQPRDDPAAGFFDQLEPALLAGRMHVILDNLSCHRSLEMLLWVWSHERLVLHFLPMGAAWMNLIEPWWKTLRNLALAGSSYDDEKELAAAIAAATDYWDAHRHPYHWRKANGNQGTKHLGIFKFQ